MDPRGSPKTSQDVPEDPQGDSAGSQGRPTALPRTPQDPRGRPKAPPKRPKDDLGELWQVFEIIEKPLVFVTFPVTEAPLDDPNLFSTFCGAPGGPKDTSRSTQSRPRTPKERLRTLNDSQGAPNSGKEHTSHAHVSPKRTSIAGNTTKTNGF